MDCQCEICKGYCEHRPGRYAPGEMEKTAAALGLTLQAFFDEHIEVDFWEGYDMTPDKSYTTVLYPIPKRTNSTSNLITGWEMFGTCHFFLEGKCSIHSTKPQECRKADHTKTLHINHKRITQLWNRPQHQQQLSELLEGTYDGTRRQTSTVEDGS